MADLLTGFDDEGVVVEETGELDQLLDGFDDTPGQQEKDNISPPLLPGWLELQGSLSLQAAVGFAHKAPPKNTPDYRGLSMLRTRGELIGDITFDTWQARVGTRGFYDAAYSLDDRSDYTHKMLNAYEQELEITEAWIQTALGDHLDFKTGRQIVVWGKSDNIRITDILNPLDGRQPGMLDIRDLRLPVAMSKLDFYTGNWNISTLVIHEPRFNKTPVYNGEFYPVNAPAPPEDEPSMSLGNQQFAAAINGVFSGWDLSIYSAYVFDNQAHVDATEKSGPVRRYSRIKMGGVSGDIALGNWLFKTEAALLHGLNFYAVPGKNYSRFDFLMAMEYSGFTEMSISIELANRHLLNFDTRLEELPDGQMKNLFQSALRVNRDFMHDTLHLTMLLSAYGVSGEDGAFERYQVEYDVRDNVMVKGGLVFYQSGDVVAFQNIGDNDRLFFELEYRF
jgi:hypothetical protein